MIRINLLPTSEAEEASSRRKEFFLAGGLLAIALAAVFAVHFFQGLRFQAVDTTLAAVEKQVAEIRKQNQDIRKMEQQKKDIQRKTRVVTLLTSPARRAASVHILDDLSESAPQMLWLTEFTEAKGLAKINGKAVDNQTVAAFARKLANSQYFKKIEIRETVQERPPTEQQQRRQIGGGRTPAPDALPIPVTRFLVEASVDYLPGLEKEIPQEEVAEEGQQEGGGQERGKSTAKKGK